MKKLFLFLSFTLTLSLYAQEPEKPGFIRDTSFTTYSAYQKEKKNFPFIEIAYPEITANIKEEYNIVYKSVEGRKLHIDIFKHRKLSGPVPVVLMIHGGGWRSGNKTMEYPMAAKLAEKGYAALPVEYRLSPEAKYPAGVEDLKDALRWIKTNAETYNFDTSKIAVLGESAGGTLAVLVGATGILEPGQATGNLKSGPQVHAIVDIDGVLDFTDPAESGKDNDPAKPSAGKLWFGASFKENPAIWEEASPLQYAGKHTPPILFVNSSLERFHAGRDEFLVKIKPYNTYYEIHTVPDTPHPFWLFHPWFEKTTNHVILFLDKIFKG